MTKQLVSTGVATVLALFMIFSYGIAVVGFMFPGAMMNLSMDLGLHGSAAMFSERVYRRDSNAENMHTALERNFQARRWSRVVYFGNKFFTHDDMQRIIDDVNVHLGTQIGGMLGPAYPMVANEWSRLRSNHVRALINTGRFSQIEPFLRSGWTEINLEQPCLAYFIVVQSDARGLTPEIRFSLNDAFHEYAIDFEDYFDDNTPLAGTRARIMSDFFMNMAGGYL